MGRSDARKVKKDSSADPAVGLLFLALSHKPFLDRVKEFRDQYHIEVPFSVRSSEDATNITEASEALPRFMKKSYLPLSMRNCVWNYLIYGKVTTAGSARYVITSKPLFTINSKGKNITYADSVSLVTYAKLSAAEERKALKELRQWQKFALHPSALMSSKIISHAQAKLRIEEVMKSRSAPRMVERYVSVYMSQMKKQVLLGKTTEEEFERVKSLNSHGVEKVRVGRTSKDVAAETLGDRNKDAVVRQKLARLKKARKKLFSG